MKKRLTGTALAAAIALFGVCSAAQADPYLQCVAFARMITGIQLFGDAWTWWSQATGHYAKGDRPEAGAVLVFKASGHMRHGHVAVVDDVLTERIIQISHANWSPIDGGRGKVEHAVTVIDVSPRNDWSEVKVWYDPIGDMGNTVYPTYGFIYRGADQPSGQTPGQIPAQTPALSYAQPSYGQPVLQASGSKLAQDAGAPRLAQGMVRPVVVAGAQDPSAVH